MVQKETSKGIVVGYGRKSKEDKNAKGISLSNQKERCQKWAKERGYQFVYFEDKNPFLANSNPILSIENKPVAYSSKALTI